MSERCNDKSNDALRDPAFIGQREYIVSGSFLLDLEHAFMHIQEVCDSTKGPDFSVIRTMLKRIREVATMGAIYSADTSTTPVCYVLMNAAGRMYWDEDSCVWSHPGDAEATLENEQDADPTAGWRVVPLHAGITQSASTPISEVAFEHALGTLQGMVERAADHPEEMNRLSAKVEGVLLALIGAPASAAIYTKEDAEAMCELAVSGLTSCQKCGLAAKTLLHPFCTHTDCPVRKSLPNIGVTDRNVTP